MRLTGLATGIDTDTMIKDMMKPYQAKVDKQKQNQQIVKWQQDLYRETIKDMRGFYDKYFDPLSKDCLLLSSNFNTTSAIVDKVGVANVTTSASAKTGTYKLNVKKLAEPPKITSNTLKDGVNTDLGLTSDTKLTFKIDGVDTEIQLKAGDKVSDLISKVNNNLKSKGIKAEYSEFTNQLTIASTKTGENSTLEIEGLDKLSKIGISSGGSSNSYNNNEIDLSALGELTDETKLDSLNGKELKIGDKTITITEDDTVKSLKDKISQNGGQDIKVVDGKIKFTTKQGVNSEFDGTPITAPGKTFTSIKGSNAEYDIIVPGGSSPISMTNASNNFTVDGIKFTLNGLGETSFTINTDVEETAEKIKGFVEDYNKLVDKTYKMVSQKKTYGYAPLTEEQKKEMSEDEIKKWESKAKEGLLKNDRYLNNFLSELRSVISTSVEGAGISLKEIGIDLTSDISKPGQLVLDENKLKDALENRGDEVVDLFTSQPKEGEDKFKSSGIFVRMKDTLYKTSMSSSSPLLKKAGYEGSTSALTNELTKKMQEQQKIIDKMEKDLIVRENAFYKKFSALEVAMNKLNSQQSYLMQQLG